METHRAAGEAVAVGGDDSTLAAREELAAVGYPGAAAHLEETDRRGEALRMLTPTCRTGSGGNVPGGAVNTE